MKKYIGVYTDMCAFFDKNLIDADENKNSFIENLGDWKKSGVNLITVGLQSPNPFGEYYKKAREQDKTKNIRFDSSAIKSGGGLNCAFLDNAAGIIKAANNFDFAVIVNILSPACENKFEDEFALVNGIFNVIDWILKQNFTNILVNIADISHTFYKSSVLNGEKIIKLLKSVREKTKDKLILGTGIKTFANFSEKNIAEYIKLSDFIPIYPDNTKNMLKKIYFFRAADKEIPLIAVKGDDLSEKYNSYGKNNLTEAAENGISWCYYDLNGFVILENNSINWDKNSSAEKKRFFETVENIV